MTMHLIDGPYFEEFELGQTFVAPSITVTEGHTAVYAALFGDRMRLPLDRHLSAKVTGCTAALVHPYLAMHLAAGQTTYASQHVKGNLFYRGVLLQRPVFVGDSLYTTTKVVGLKQNKPKPGRAATGMVALEMTTVNQRDEVVLHFWRCPMIGCKVGGEHRSRRQFRLDQRLLYTRGTHQRAPERLGFDAAGVHHPWA